MKKSNLFENDKYITLTLYAFNMDKKERQLFLRNFFCNTSTVCLGDTLKTGLLLKFNNSLGFKEVEWQPDKDSFGYKPMKLDISDDYLSPYGMLVTNMYWFNREDEIVTFIIPIKEVKEVNHPQYNYSTLEMVIKFQSFLNKIYHKHIRTEIDFKSELKMSLKDRVLSYVYCVMAEGEHYCCEMSLHRKLKLKEKRYILDIMKDYVSFKPAIDQYECETCREYNEKCPYHMEFLKYETLKREYDECIKYGYIVSNSVLEALEDCK